MSTKECGRPAVRRYTWPGRDESFICQEHLPKLMGVAAAMGLYVQLIPTDSDQTCKQTVSDSRDA